ncbi:hypothetical protein QBC41DRAFT_229794 [Cercophora samala]|uniref:Uncharacterized protein n=1 Tax=Cercophora samala TaxID=330535 RepID=A0AA39Z9N3_9PEZI|nr:hypothetical protein QBC41DRAFT_229794 [Cercophora samala]
MVRLLRSLLPNRGLHWPKNNVVLGKTRRDRAVVEVLGRVMPVDKQHVRQFLLKMVQYAADIGGSMIENHNEYGDPSLDHEIDPYWLFREMHMHFTHEMGVDNEMGFSLFVALFMRMMDAREAYRNWWDINQVSYTRMDDELTDGLDHLYFNVRFIVHNELEMNCWLQDEFEREEAEEEEAAALDSVADGLQAMEVGPVAPPRVDLEGVRQALEDMDLDETMEDAEVEGEVELPVAGMEGDRMELDE